MSFSSISLCAQISLLLLVILLSTIDGKPTSRPLLRGVTIRNWPYADRPNDRYEGFVVDLMNLISEKVGFDYRLYFSPDGKYGTEGKDGHINGMIGEVFKNKADFAIADLTVTDSRRKFIDFTEPFLENQLSAIVRRDDAGGLRTLEDLVTANELHRTASLPEASLTSRFSTSPSSGRGIIAYGTYRTGSTYFHLSRSRDPVAVRMYNWMLRHPQALVSSAKEGFDRVNAGRYAFIVESTFAEYLTGLYCNLTTLYDTRRLYSRQFAIALPRGSPHLGAFNAAIRELKATGAIEKLRAVYWTNRCNQQTQQQRPLSAENESKSSEPAAEPSSVLSKVDSVQSVPPRQPELPPVMTTNNRRGGSESADDRTSGNRIEHPNIDWSAGGHHNQQQHHHRTHQRVPPGSTRTLNPVSEDTGNAFANSRYHHRSQNPVQQVASSSPEMQKLSTYLLSSIFLLILHTRFQFW